MDNNVKDRKPDEKDHGCKDDHKEIFEHLLFNVLSDNILILTSKQLVTLNY